LGNLASLQVLIQFKIHFQFFLALTLYRRGARFPRIGSVAPNRRAMNGLSVARFHQRFLS
jgi:hypothetical protein